VRLVPDGALIHIEPSTHAKSDGTTIGKSTSPLDRAYAKAVRVFRVRAVLSFNQALDQASMLASTISIPPPFGFVPLLEDHDDLPFCCPAIGGPRQTSSTVFEIIENRRGSESAIGIQAESYDSS
jgi:hypothetical protein